MKWHKLVYPALVGAALLGSAMVLPVLAEPVPINPPQDNVPGSLLVFPIFDIRSGSSTTIRITDTMGGNAPGPGRIGVPPSVGIHINYVCKGTSTLCDQMDDHKKLTFHETLEIHVEEDLLVPGCEEGYVVVFAENAAGDPISYNNLIGSYHIGNAGDNASYGGNAIAFQANAGLGVQIGLTGTDDVPQLQFGTVSSNDYVALPRYLHSTFQAAETVEGGKLELVLLTLNVKSGFKNDITDVKIYYWDADENMKSKPLSFYCWVRRDLADLDNHFDEANFTEWGSLKVVHIGASAVLGVVIETGTGFPEGEGNHGTVARNTFHVGSHPGVTNYNAE